MYNDPKNYIEAKKILNDSVRNDMFQDKVRTTRLRAGVVTALGFGVSYLVGTLTNNPDLVSSLSPTIIGLGLSFLFPNVGMRKAAQSIEDGSFYEGKSQEEVIRLATNYAHKYNEYERLKNKRRK